MRLAVVMVTAIALPAAADPPHALITLGVSAGHEDNDSTRTTDLTLAGRATPTLWGFATGRTGSSDWPCGDCVGDGKLREGTLGALYLPCRGTLCVGVSGAIGYARREVYYPGGITPRGVVVAPSWELEDWFVVEARGRVMLRLADHIDLDAGVGLRYLRRLFDQPEYANAGGAVASIALGVWL